MPAIGWMDAFEWLVAKRKENLKLIRRLEVFLEYFCELNAEMYKKTITQQYYAEGLVALKNSNEDLFHKSFLTLNQLCQQQNTLHLKLVENCKSMCWQPLKKVIKKYNRSSRESLYALRKLQCIIAKECKKAIKLKKITLFSSIDKTFKSKSKSHSKHQMADKNFKNNNSDVDLTSISDTNNSSCPQSKNVLEEDEEEKEKENEEEEDSLSDAFVIQMQKCKNLIKDSQIKYNKYKDEIINIESERLFCMRKILWAFYEIQVSFSNNSIVQTGSVVSATGGGALNGEHLEQFKKTILSIEGESIEEEYRKIFLPLSFENCLSIDTKSAYIFYISSLIKELFI